MDHLNHFVYMFQLYFELYEQEKERYEKELKEYSARDIIPPPSDSIPVPAREGVIPSHSLQIKKERDWGSHGRLCLHVI